MKHRHYIWCRKKQRNTQLVFTIKINKSIIKILAMELPVKDFLDTNLSLEDSDTKAAIIATFANIKLTSSDPSIFTTDTDVNTDGTADVVGVAAGTAQLNVTADATYTDSNTGKEVTKSKNATIDVTVTAPAPTDENTDLVVTLTNAQPVP